MADELDILAASVSAQWAQGNRNSARHMIQAAIDEEVKAKVKELGGGLDEIELCQDQSTQRRD